jgi:hypothetical protein
MTLECKVTVLTINIKVTLNEIVVTILFSLKMAVK